MSQKFKILVPILFLFAIGAAAQTITTANAGAVAAQNNQTAGSAADEAGLNQLAELYMGHFENAGLVDHTFMKGIASLAPTRAVSTEAISLCKPSCAPGLVCCLCLATTCETRAQCNIDCQK